jgi:hypothetical protein
MNPKIAAINTWIGEDGEVFIGSDPDPSSRDWVVRIYNGDGEEMHSRGDEEILFGRGATEEAAIDCFMEENLIDLPEQSH